MSKKENDGTTRKRELLIWTGPMDDAFIQAMLNEKDKGNKIDGTFTTQAYTNMVTELRKSLQREFTKKHLQNRLKTLKEHFSRCYDIFRGASLSGFSWNSNTKYIEAEDEVWEALIKEKPEAKKWRTKPISHYNEMLELFAKDRATGFGAETAKDKKNRMKNNDHFETIDEIDQSLETDEISLENFNTGEEINVTSTTPPSHVKLSSKLSSKRKKRKVEKVMESSRPHVYSEVEIYKELELMCLGPEEIASAYLFLVERPEKARAIFGC
ncbi:hypothetical protein SSX86_006413 [Deinandra increscens subsp. villosa]|uniref:Myb/SANT-like domain-containing protein n=1 Tax=Deinandra increscens subsp. villosa TaxID=3103831 RepID=A0AAP0DF82_9ASTR